MRVFALLEGSSNSPPFWWRIWKDNILWKPICSWFQGGICTAHTDCQCIRAWHFHDQLLTKTNTGRHYFPYCCRRGQRYKRRHQCRSSAQIFPERYFLSPFGKWIKSCKFVFDRTIFWEQWLCLPLFHHVTFPWSCYSWACILGPSVASCPRSRRI